MAANCLVITPCPQAARSVAPAGRRASPAQVHACTHAARRAPDCGRRAAPLFSGRAASGLRASRLAAVAASAGAAEDDEPWEVDLQVTGMACEGCVENVTKALKAAKGVVSVSVDLASGVATLGVQAETAFDAMADANRLADVVKAAGFEATPII